MIHEDILSSAPHLIIVMSGDEAPLPLIVSILTIYKTKMMQGGFPSALTKPIEVVRICH